MKPKSYFNDQEAISAGVAMNNIGVVVTYVKRHESGMISGLLNCTGFEPMLNLWWPGGYYYSFEHEAIGTDWDLVCVDLND